MNTMKKDFHWPKIYAESKIGKKHKTFFFEFFLKEMEHFLKFQGKMP
jgi:hypothetical protein